MRRDIILNLSITVIIFLVPQFSLGDMVKFVDDQGIVHYTDNLDKVPEKYLPSAEVTGTKARSSGRNSIQPNTVNVLFRVSVAGVERTGKPLPPRAKDSIKRIYEKGLYKWYFEDELINILWYPESKMEGMLFELYNKTDYTLKIIWDESSFVDVWGKNHRVMHSGVNFIDRNASQPPTIVIKKGSVEDGFFPADYVYFDRKWKNFPIIGQLEANSVQEAQSGQRSYLGKSFKFLMPFEIQGNLYEYIFTFTVYDVQM